MRLRWRGKDIPDPWLEEDVAGVRRVSFQFAPQSVDIHLQQMIFTRIRAPPDML